MTGVRTRTAGQVARLLGVAESTLRSWHRRYGIGPRAARPGGYRRYTEDDVELLRRMHELVRNGMLPSDAARAVGATSPSPPDQLLPELLAATHDLDSGRCLGLLERGLAERGVVEFWERVCRPALAEIDATQRSERPGEDERVDREHVLSWAIAAALHRFPPGGGRTRPSVLLACVDGEHHTLPLEALAAALGERGVAVRMLGAAVPVDSLAHAVRVAGPDAVLLWAHRAQTAQPPALAVLRRLGTRPVAAGPGWSGRDLDGVEHVGSLSDALAVLG
ncbi:MerR family transcriptional regulator [Actinophytocola xanthii]|uniref:MerR family transcriptional regulator n=1 Tax=Actinophytocola xanthii TaxID=1912961 RepID=UPI001301931C|nr:MerR family transcriptional regulator [Actinophytocola xanthii]